MRDVPGDSIDFLLFDRMYVAGERPARIRLTFFGQSTMNSHSFFAHRLLNGLLWRVLFIWLRNVATEYLHMQNNWLYVYIST